MTLWFDLNINRHTIGQIEITRTQHLDLTDPELDHSNAVCTYTVAIDGLQVGTIEHRYGDGAFTLTEKACRLLAEHVNTTNTRPRS